MTTYQCMVLFLLYVWDFLNMATFQCMSMIYKSIPFVCVSELQKAATLQHMCVFKSSCVSVSLLQNCFVLSVQDGVGPQEQQPQ